MKSTKFYKGFSIDSDKENNRKAISLVDMHQKANQSSHIQKQIKERDQILRELKGDGKRASQLSHFQKTAPCLIRKVSKKRDHIYGDPEAEWSIVEYLDFECQFCKEYNPILKKLVKCSGGKINWVSRHFPAIYRNPGALLKAEATECANELGGTAAFWEYSELIFSYNQTDRVALLRNGLVNLAYKIGLDGQKFGVLLDNGKLQFRVLEDLTGGAKIGIFQTPSKGC